MGQTSHQKGINSGCSSFSRGPEGSDTERNNEELQLTLLLPEAGVTKRINLGVNSTEAHSDLHPRTKN